MRLGKERCQCRGLVEVVIRVIYGARRSDFDSLLNLVGAGLLCAAFAVSAIALIVKFDNLRRKGDALFQEISNDLQNVPGDSLRSATGREIRILLRELSAESELPLFSGRSGPGVYAVTNLILMGMAVLLLLL